MPRPPDPLRRALILRVAREQFARDGFAGATMADIARGAGMGVGSLYVYFSTKDAIALSLLQTYLDELENAIVPPMVELCGDEALAQSITAGFQLVTPNEDLIVLLHQLSPELIGPICQRLPQVMEPAIQRQMTRGYFRPLDPHFITHWVNDQINCAINACVLEKRGSLELSQRQLIDLISRALLPDIVSDHPSERERKGVKRSADDSPALSASTSMKE